MAHVSFLFHPNNNNQTQKSGQLVLLYDVRRSKPGGQIEVMNGFFVHFVAPSGLKPGKKHVVFVLDKSGSMFGKKFTQLKVM